MWPFKKKPIEEVIRKFAIVSHITKDGIMLTYGVLFDNHGVVPDTSFSSKDINEVIEFVKNKYGSRIIIYGSFLKHVTNVIYNGNIPPMPPCKPPRKD